MARTAVVAGTATAVVGGVQGHQQAKAQSQQNAMDSQAQMADMQQQLTDLQAQQAPPPAAPAAAPAPAAGGDLIGELEKLASLKSAGILSDEEFAAAKAKLLG